MRQLVSASVAAIVHDQRTSLLLQGDGFCHFRIGGSCRRYLAGVGIPHHFLLQDAWIQLGHDACGLVGVVHVLVVVAVVAHEHHGVLPCAGILVFHIGQRLVGQHLGLVGIPDGEAANGYVGLAAIAAACKQRLAIVEQAEIVFRHIAIGTAVRVLTLIAKQEIVGSIACPCRGVHAVVPCAIAEKQQVLGHLSIAFSTVVEHFHVAAVGVGVGCAAGELIIQFVGRYNAHRQSVALLVHLLDAISLSRQFSCQWHDDDHIAGFVGMVVLIRDVVNIFGTLKC